MKSKKRFARGAVVAALTLGMSSLFGVAAQADTKLGNIDAGETGSITVHKHASAGEGATKANPDGTGSVGGVALADVEFTLYKLKAVDLSTPDGWKALDDYTAACPPANATEVEALTTGEDGIAAFEDLEVGAYVVCETAAPATVVDRAAPFLVTIPLRYSNDWLYDVHAYPKNSVTSIEKDVEVPTAPGIGSEVVWPVTTTVPTMESGKDLTYYVVQDTFDSRLADLGVNSVTLDGVALTADVDYEVVVSGQTVRVEFTDAGLKQLAAKPGKSVVTEFSTTVVTLGDGVIKNKAIVFVNDPENKNGLESNEVETRWGDLVIQKSDSKNKKLLSGAVFEVYVAEDPLATGDACLSQKATGNALKVPNNEQGSTQFTTGDDGKITVPGLWVGDSNNDYTARCYVIKEIQAPAGYVTPEGAAAFKGVEVKVGATATSEYDVDVPNVPSDMPDLPLTGAAGRMLMMIGGSALLLGGLGFYLVRRARANA